MPNLVNESIAERALHLVDTGAAPRGTTVIAAILALGALIVGGAIWWHSTGPDAGAGYDFRQYLIAARTIAAGGNPYHRLSEAVTQLGIAGTSFHASGYVYPPLFALLLSGLVRLGLDDRAIWIVWNGGVAAAVMWMGYEVWRPWFAADATWSTPRWLAQFAPVMVSAAVLIVPAVAMYDLSLGQTDLFLTALAVGSFGLWTRRHPLAPLPLALALAVKPTLALLVLFWVWKGDWRTLWRCAALAAAFVVMPFLMIGLAAIGDYFIFTTHWNAFGDNADAINQSIFGMLLRLFTVNPTTHPLWDAPWLVWPVRLLAIIGVVLLWMRAVPRGDAATPERALGEGLLALPLVLLISPFSEDIHFCLILPTMVWLVIYAWRTLPVRSLARWTIGLTFAVFCIPRFQEVVQADHLVPFPGQTDPSSGWLVILARSGAMLAIAVVTLVVGSAILRQTARHSVAVATTKPVTVPTGVDVP